MWCQGRGWGVSGLLVTLAAPVTADPHAITYKGLTLGTPIPDTMTPVGSQAWTDRTNEDVPEVLTTFCNHEFPVLGDGRLVAVTDTCDGAVISISVTETVGPVTSIRDSLTLILPADIDGLTFNETTLAQP